MKFQWRCLIIIAILFIGGTLKSENKRVQFVQLSSEQGLSNSTVISIVQDKHQLFWFATFDGLNRYDGYKFTVYRNERANKNSLLNDVLRCLFLDSENKLWVGSKSGLSLYVAERDNFDNYVCQNRKGQSVQVNAMLEYDAGRLLLGTEYGLQLFNKNSRKFEDFPSFSNSAVSIQSLARQGDNILMGTTSGLYIYRMASKQFSTVHTALTGITIQAILPQSDSRIWIGTEGAGLFRLNLTTGEIKNYKKDPANPQSISSNYIRSLAFDAQFRLWVGTFHALSIMNNGSESFENYYHDPIQAGSLSQNSVRSIYMDTQGGMWLGTYYGGINYYHALKNQFGHIYQNPYTRSLNDRVMSCILEDTDGKMWIGTNDKGVDVYDPRTGNFRYIMRENTPSLTSNNVKVLLPSHNRNIMYLGTHGGGLFMVNKASGACTRIPAANNLATEDVYALAYDNSNQLWIGTLNGLFVYNEASKVLTKVNLPAFSSEQVMFLKTDSRQRLWIGGEKSLAVYSLKTKKVHNFSSDQYNGNLNNGSVNCIFEDSKRRIWIGTRGGLIQYNENGTFKSYGKEEGLASNMVYGILEDSFGRLWLSTNHGISCCIPEHKDPFRNYSQIDGLPFNQFNMYSFCQSHSGLMYFGGINGIVTFYPELLIDNPYTPQPIISRIQIFNKEVNPFDATGILSNNILNTKEIKLQPDQSNFTLEFVVPNYLSGQHNVFAYMLEGYDKDWIYSENRVASYSNLPHGTYTFKVKAANSDEKWNEKPTELVIVVLPHWWQTVWAFLLFVIAAVAAGRFALKIIRQRQSMQQQLRMERIEKEKMEEVNQMKMRFFINISHEFRTPLTLILSPLQEMIERNTDKWQRSQLAHVQKNANKLLHLVNQLMDYRRAELGVFELKIRKVLPVATINDTFGLFDKLAKRKKITYRFENRTREHNFLIDTNYLELILSNLLSNAFKFTPDGGEISVILEEDVNSLVLEVADTGCGIPTDKQTLIFDRFYQIDQENMGTGIGLSLIKRLVDLHHGRIELKSTVGEGSTFTVCFPQNEEIYDLVEADETEVLAVHTTNAKHVEFVAEESIDEELSEEEENKQATLLIVEDNLDVMDYLSERLSKKYLIATAPNGLVALDYLKENDVDLVLTDVMMPEMDGIRLCKNIKQDISTCHIPVIILSAKSNIEDQLQGLQVGADDYVPKPFTYSVLSVKIQNMLKSRRRTLEYYSKSLEVEPEKITFNAMDELLLKKALTIVNDHLDDPDFSADQFCSEMGMSRSNLHLKLKAITGESTIDFIRKIRFNEACKLLLDGRYNVAEVSMKVGFNTPSYFATSFKKYFGVLPTEYVKSRRT